MLRSARYSGHEAGQKFPSLIYLLTGFALLTCTIPPGPGWSLCFRSGSNAVPVRDVGDA